MGWLYLKREWKRMADLIKIGLDHLSECEEEKKQEEIRLEALKTKKERLEIRQKELDKRYREQENTEIHDLVHAFNLTPEQLKGRLEELLNISSSNEKTAIA